MTREIVSGRKQDWATPRDFFASIQPEFGFTLDVCAARYNHVLPRYLGDGGLSPDGLAVDWAFREDGFPENCFCNPPYEDIEAWMRWAIAQVAKNIPSTFLIPANTDTRWFHKYAVLGQIDFIKGRLSFEDLTPADEEIARLLLVYDKKPDKKHLKNVVLCLNEWDKEKHEGEPEHVQRARALCRAAYKRWPSDIRHPGPGFPSMLVTYHPDAPAGGGGRFRTRDSKTGKLL